MMRITFSILFLLSIVISGCSTTNLEQMDIVKTEREFAAYAISNGTNEAFAAFIAEDGILFRPGPVNGKEFLAQQPNRVGPPHLKWKPEKSITSSSGDMGFNIGPWVYGEDLARGYFLTVWSRQENGEWKFLIDQGVTTQEQFPEGYFESLLLSGFAGTKNPREAKESLSDVRLAEEKIAKIAQTNLYDAYQSYLTSETWLMDNGPLAAQNDETRNQLLSSRPTSVKFTHIDGAQSRNGDLVYTHGSAVWSRENNSEMQGAYVRIWQHKDSGWKIIGEMFFPTGQ